MKLYNPQYNRKMNLKSEIIIEFNACHICDGELYEGWRVGCDDLVFRAGAEEALEVNEVEVKQKAIEAFRQFVKQYCAESGRKDISEDSEHYVKVFKELINS